MNIRRASFVAVVAGIVVCLVGASSPAGASASLDEQAAVEASSAGERPGPVAKCSGDKRPCGTAGPYVCCEPTEQCCVREGTHLYCAKKKCTDRQ